MTHTCSCDGPGQCPVFGKNMNARHYQICSGKALPDMPPPPDEATREAYVAKWSGGARKSDCGCGSKKFQEAPATPGVPPSTEPVVATAVPVKRARESVGAAMGRKIPGPPVGNWSFVKTAQLVADAAALASHLPPEADLVIGVARSGLLPAATIATHLHLPLLSIGESGVVVDPGHGNRIPDAAPPEHVLLVDDTVAGGGTMRRLLPLVRRAYPGARVSRVVVYAHPNAVSWVDYAWALYPGKHYLEWNWANSKHVENVGLDFDGIICRDARPEEDDDGPRYKKFLLEATPLHLPRRRPVTVVATARHEKYRAETEAWLKRHRVEVKKLVMRDWDYPERDRWGAVARWKAKVFREAGVSLIAESDSYQAHLIAGLTNRPVVCPAAGEVLTALGPPKTPADFSPIEILE